MTTEWVARSISDIIGEANYRDQVWLTKHRELREDTQSYGWEPYPAASFVNLLTIAMGQTRNQGMFIDVGCGIGTKVRIAEAMGLDAYGVELFPEYVAEARRTGMRVQQYDVRTDGFDYSRYDIVYINHPLRDTVAQDAVEYRLQDRMKPGAVLITVNNIRTMPLEWDMISRPIWSNLDKLRFDWVAQKPGGGNGSRPGS